MKKLLAIVLSAVMLMSVLSVGISASTTVTPYEFGSRKSIIKFFDSAATSIAPVEIQVVKLPERFNGKLAVCYIDDEGLEAFTTNQFAAKFNTLYDVKETSEDSYIKGKTIYMNTADGEELGYNKVIFITIPEGYVVYPAQEPAILENTGSWKIEYNVITEEAYAAILAAEAAVEEVVEETAEAVEETEEVAEETEEAAEETEEAEYTIEIDLDAIAAAIKEIVGEEFDLDAYLLDFADEEGLITVSDFLLAYTLLINTDLLSEEIVEAIIAAIEELLGEEAAAIFAEYVNMFLEIILESLTAEESVDETTEEVEAAEETTEEVEETADAE